MILSINQPAYLPWLGYFHRIAVSDVHVVLDHVQFEKNSFTNRNRLRSGDDWTWLTVPVATKGRFGDLAINHVEIDNRRDWRRKHWRTIELNYAKSRHFDDYAPALKHVYDRPWKKLSELCDHMLGLFLGWLGIETPLVYSSELGPRGAKVDLVLEICKKLEGDVYLSGSLGQNYLEEDQFGEAAIKIVYQDFQHPEYDQGLDGNFIGGLGILDLLFHHGAEGLAIILKDQHSISKAGSTGK